MITANEYLSLSLWNIFDNITSSMLLKKKKEKEKEEKIAAVDSSLICIKKNSLKEAFLLTPYSLIQFVRINIKERTVPPAGIITYLST